MWMGEELGEKDFLGLETSKRYKRERRAEFRPSAGTLTGASLRRISVNSVNGGAEGSQPGTLAP